MSDDQNNAGGNNGGGAGVVFPGWMSSLPDAHKTNERFAQFKEAPEVWNKFDSLLQAEGRAVSIPDEKSTPEEVAAFWTKVGKPEKADGYNITKPADLPENVPYDPAIESEFKKFAHENHFTKPQAEKLYGWYFELAKNGAAIQAKKQADAEAETKRLREEAVGKLKTEWGPKFDANAEIAKRAFREYAKDNPEAVKLIDNATYEGVPLGDHPVFAKIFHSIALKTMDDKATFAGSGGSGDETPEAAERRKAELMFPSMKK